MTEEQFISEMLVPEIKRHNSKSRVKVNVAKSKGADGKYYCYRLVGHKDDSNEKCGVPLVIDATLLDFDVAIGRTLIQEHLTELEKVLKRSVA